MYPFPATKIPVYATALYCASPIGHAQQVISR